MTVTWSHPEDGQYFGYILEYGGTGLSTEIGRTPASSIIPRYQNSITLKGLTPNTNYEVRISSFVDYDGVVTESEVVTKNAATGEKLIHFNYMFLKRCMIYCKSGNIPGALIFGDFAQNSASANSRNPQKYL